MKKNNSFYSITSRLFLAGLLLIVVSACKDDDEPSVNHTDFLTAKSWKPIHMEGSVNGMVDKNAVIKECDKDDIITFSKDGKYHVTTGPNYCDEDRKEETGTWEWKNNDQKILRFATDGDVQDMAFVRLTSTTFKVTYSEMVDLHGDNVEFKISVTYEAM